MTLARLPVLTEDGARLDWPQAHYEVKVNLKGKQAVVQHKISGASELGRLLDDSAAEYVTELRCPRTLLSRQIRSFSPEQQLTWHDEHISGDVFLVPGIVAMRDVELPGSALNSFVWPEWSVVAVPTGWWLARGEVRSVKPLVASLVRFRRDDGSRLAKGQMSVEEDRDGAKPYFRVNLAADLYDKRRQDRDVQIAGLIAAFGLLPRSSWSEGGENADSSVASQLRDKLDNKGVPDWDDEDFDPALAATTLEAFSEQPKQDSADER